MLYKILDSFVDVVFAVAIISIGVMILAVAFDLISVAIGQ